MDDGEIMDLDDDERRLLRTVGPRGAIGEAWGCVVATLFVLADLAILCVIVWALAGCAPVARTPDAGPAEACSFSATGPCEHHTSVPVCGDAWYVVCPRGGGAGAWATHGCPELVEGEPVCADGSAVDCVHMQRCDAEWARGPGYVEGDAGSGG